MVNASEPPQGGGVAGSGHGTVHVRTTVAMELATALHHSAQRVGGPCEGEVHAMHDGLRAQKRPLPGTRPGLPPEPEPQVRAATVGYVTAPVPFLSAPLLADTAAEAVDARTVHFLLTDAVKHLKEGRKMEEEEERRWMAQVKAMTELSRQLPRKRKSKKRKKRKLPRAPLPRGGRPCALQRQVPTVQVVHVLEGAPASVHRQSAGFQCCATETWYPQCCCTEDRLVPSGTVLGQSRCARVVQRQLLRSLVQKTRGVSTGAVLGQGDMPVVILSDAFGQTAQKTVVVPQLEFFVGRRHSFRDAEADPHGPDYSADHRVRFWWSMSLLCGSCKFSGAAVEKTFVLPQFQLVEKSPPVVCGSDCRKLRSFRSCSS